MFTSTQLNSLRNSSYFKVIELSAGNIVLESKCTGHQWRITGAGYGNAVLLFHRHSQYDPWHAQAFYGQEHTLPGAIKSIKAHDNYQNRKEKEKRKQLEARRAAHG